MKTKTFALALTGGVMFAGIPAIAFAVDDDAPRRNVSHTGDYTVKKNQEINGNLTVRNGNVVIRGEVEGTVRQLGRGSVTVVASGSVERHVIERGAGNVNVRGDVDGNVVETGRGHARIHRSAEVDGNVKERNAGHLVVWRGADVDGRLSEGGAGRIIRR